ncbi:cutinase family protein [Pseudarthrobacter oxydans]|uniref:cutinase family protein n=1 Tax=Pseudarthrobacter oxydans TaxID=1671 RepID=UPI0037F701B8
MAFFAALVLAVPTSLAAAAASEAAPSCGDIHVVGVAGSGELDDNTSAQKTAYMGSTVRDFYDKLRASYSGSATAVSGVGIVYPAIRALVLPFQYRDSVSAGVGKTLEYISRYCKATPLVLAGYSQGADVVRQAYDALGRREKNRVAAVILFGDSRFDPSDTLVNRGTYIQRPEGHGYYGGRLSPISQNKERSYCAFEDPICNYVGPVTTLTNCIPPLADSVTICPHFTYRQDGSTLLAATFVKQLAPPKMSQLVISPQQATITAGETQTYTATAYGLKNKLLGEVTASTAFSITPDGSCTGSVCFATLPGTHTVTATNGSKSATATLNVQPLPDLDHLVLSPTSATISVAGTQSYSAAGFDSSSRPLGDVTASTRFSITPDGSCIGTVCTADNPGVHTVTGTTQGKSATATLQVQPDPTAVGLTNVQAVTTALGSEFAVKSDGTVWGWGANYKGILGAGVTADYSPVPVQVLGLSGVKKVFSSYYNGVSVFALKTDGTVWAWGSNDMGQLGNGSTADSAVPVQASGLSGVQDLETSFLAPQPMVFAVKSDGSLWEWGYDHILPQPSTGPASSNVPVQVTKISGVKEVVTNSYSVMVLKADGTVWGWGQNDYGQLGDGTTTDTSTPVQVAGLSNVRHISLDALAAYAVKADGTVWAWGRNGNGQLGNGTTTDSRVPVQVHGLSGVRSFIAVNETLGAVNGDGTLWTWGANHYGQLGNGTNADSATPAKVHGLSNVKSLATEGRTMYAVNGDGREWAWGYNAFGQIGNGTTTDSNVPRAVTGLTNVTSTVTDGGGVTFAVKGDGTVWAWGYSSSGQLGSGATQGRSLVPVQVG